MRIYLDRTVQAGLQDESSANREPFARIVRHRVMTATPLPRFALVLAALLIAAIGCGNDQPADEVGAVSAAAEPAPTVASPVDSDADEPLPFDAADLSGLCADSISTFAADEPGPYSTAEEAIEAELRSRRAFEGLEFRDGKIVLRGDEVGHYRVASRPNDTFDIAYVYWCHP